MAGYSAAPSSLAFSACWSSRSCARCSSTSPRLPPCSPAPTTATKMPENSAGWRASALAKVLPLLTSARRSATRLRSASRSASLLSELSARSSGKPEATRLASCRVHTHSALALNTRRWKMPAFWVPASCAPAFTGSTTMGTSDWLRNCVRAALAESASTVPLRNWPSAVRASKA